MTDGARLAARERLARELYATWQRARGVSGVGWADLTAAEREAWRAVEDAARRALAADGPPTRPGYSPRG